MNENLNVLLQTHTEGDFNIDFNTNDVKLNSFASTEHKNPNQEESDGISPTAIAKSGDGHVDQNITPLPLQKVESNDWMSSQELYNLIVAETWQASVQMHDVGYMLLVDCR